MKNYKEHFEYKDGIGVLKYKKHWWSRWRYAINYETQGLNKIWEYKKIEVLNIV